MKIIVDALGGDNAPATILEGCKNALAAFPALSLVVTGPESLLSEAFCAPEQASRVEIVHAPTQIRMDEPPVQAIKQKRDSSLVMGLELLKAGRGDAFVTCGSTGATLSGALLRVGRIRGINRPALAPILPNKAGTGVMLIDCGANMDCKALNLQQFALMGDIYMRTIMGLSNPRLGLANVGTEEEKGNELLHEAFPLVKGLPGINFVGNIEGRDVFDVDICVADGFSGNLLLKAVEGTAKFMSGLIKQELTASLPRKLGALTVKSAFANIKKKMDYTEYGGAPLLGIDGVVLKGHGSSNARALYNTIRQAMGMVEGQVVEKIRQKLEEQL